MNINFLNGTKCLRGEGFTTSVMTAEEIETVKDMVRNYKNVTVTGVHICDKGIDVWLAENYLSRAKYPNNHREYREYRNLQQTEWQGWF